MSRHTTSTPSGLHDEVSTIRLARSGAALQIVEPQVIAGMESISRISSLLETARDLTLEAARDAGPRKPSRPLPAPQIKKLLDSRQERDVLDGLRRVIAMQYANPPQPTLTFFPAVLKTLSNSYPSTRPLVYNYLTHHAQADPDTALLAINTIQKSLSDSSPRVRAMALRTMAGLRVPVISQIVSLAIKKGVNDLSPLVRKTAALACVKCLRLDLGTRPQMEEYLATLVLDRQYYVAGAAVQAFMEVCPDRMDLVHPAYRRLCKTVVDMDEWGQLALIRLMTVYARRCFPRRTKRQKRTVTMEEKGKDFYDEQKPEEDQDADQDEVEIVDPDLELFLKSIQPLLQSRNSAVIIAVTRAYLYLSPTNYLHQATGPLIALLRSPQDIQQVALHNIVQVCLSHPKSFVPYFRHFLIRAVEAPYIWRLKLEVLTLIFPHGGKETQALILAELEHFSQGHTSDLVHESVRAIGRCAQGSDAYTSRRCLSLLLKQIRSSDETLVGEAIEVVRYLIQRSPDDHRTTVVRLAKNLDTLTSPTARASIIWLVGEFAGNDANQNIAADVLRILIKGYANERDEVRMQIVLLAAKLYLHHLNAHNAKQKAVDALNGDSFGQQPQESEVISPAVDGDADGFQEAAFASAFLASGGRQEKSAEQSDPIELLYNHIMLLARYTPSYELRDRARIFRALLAQPNSTELASLLLLAPKPVPQAPSPSEARKSFALGSASLVVGEEAGIGGVRGYEALQDWVEQGREPDPTLRDDVGGKEEYKPQKTTSAGQRLDEALQADGTQSKVNGGVKRGKTLDDWLDEESESSEGSETDEETDDESEYETESEEDEGDERAALVR